jgi:hypothetical protein
MALPTHPTEAGTETRAQEYQGGWTKLFTASNIINMYSIYVGNQPAQACCNKERHSKTNTHVVECS